MMSMARHPSPVRFGGVRTPRRYLFELTGGRLCLDFANTVDKRKADDRRDLLQSYHDLLDWGTQAGAITAADARTLRRQATRKPRAAAFTLAKARVLREAIFLAFSAAAAAKRVPPWSLSLLDSAIAHFAPRRRLERTRGGLSWRWRDDATDFERPLWPVAWSAGELLTSSELDRVRECAGAGCAWLFLDTSKNRTRRWCDMSICGNRAKARRHYAKVKQEQ